jgi:hypothetical protein
VFISIFYNQKLYTKENGHQIFSVMILKSVFMDMKGYDTLYMYLSRKKDAFSPPSSGADPGFQVRGAHLNFFLGYFV